MAIAHISIIIVFICFCFVHSSNSNNQEYEDYCRIPGRIEGTCKDYLNCKPFVDWLNNLPTPISNENRKLIISSQCGFTTNSVKVCCPNTTTLRTDPETRSPIISDQIPDVTKHTNLKLVPQEECGLLDTSDRILFGNVTSLFEFPWMALISYKTANGLEFQCGGTIINDRYILTAAHCLADLKNKYIAGIRLGEYDISSFKDCDTYLNYTLCADPVQDFAVEEIIPHPKYSRKRNEISNDIGLIRLAKKANLTTNNVKTICLPISQEINNPNLTTATVTGWGQTHNDTSSNVLMKLHVPIITHGECTKIYENITSITSRQICSRAINQRDSCRGDSGGPLQSINAVEDDIRYVQYGVLSFGSEPCGREDRPAVFTKLVKYLDWILDTIKP